MSLMTDILGAVSRNPGGTVSELADTLETAEKRVRDNLIHARNRELVTMRKDDVTSLPGYTLTTAGKEFLAKSTTEAETPEPEYDPDSVSFDAKKRADANQRRAEDAEKDAMTLMGIIADIRKAIGDPTGKIMLGDLAKAVEERTASAVSPAQFNGFAPNKLPPILISCVAKLWPGSEGMFWESFLEKMPARIDEIKEALSAEESLRRQIDAVAAALPGTDYMDPPDGGSPSLAEQVARMRADLATERQARMALQEQMNADPGVDVKDAAVGYLVKAPKRKPRLLTKPESAVSAAMAAARNGSGRGEVFALVPVGRAVRGAEWKDAE